VNPDTGDYFERCPWLKKSLDGIGTTCEIYHDRPEDCRHYPVDIEQMVRHDCEMLERRDLVDVKRAQKRLDTLMADSRPPVIKQY
jgi:Fe-S-cluster containining protein